MGTTMSFSTQAKESHPTGTSSQVRLPRKRRPWLVVVAVLLVAGAGYGNYLLISTQNERVQVLVLARDVLWGQAIQAADLAVAQAVVDPQVQMVSAVSKDTVVGEVATTDLAEGAFLHPRDLTGQPVPRRGEQVFGLVCKLGTLPRGVRPGDPVAVAPITNGQTAGTVFRARVVAVAPPDSTGSVTVDVVVSTERAGDAVAAASGSVIVSLLGPEI